MTKEELIKLFESTCDTKVTRSTESIILFIFDRFLDLHAECDALKKRIEKLENKGERDG